MEGEILRILDPPEIEIYIENEIVRPKKSYAAIASESIVPHSDFILSSEGRIMNIADKLEFKDILGEGKFGKVYRALHTTTNKTYAIKSFNLLAISKHERENVFKEGQVTISHDLVNVVKYYGWFNYIHNGIMLCGICMDLLPGKTLTVYLDEFISKMPTNEHEYIVLENELFLLMKETAKGIASLHQAGIVHRDIKPDNILAIRHNNILDVRIVDLGLASNETTLARRARGTPLFMPPEAFPPTRYEYSIENLKSNDIWALGVTFFSLAFNAYPFDGKNLDDLAFNLHTNQLYIANFGVYPKLYPIIQQCMVRKIFRPSAERVLDLMR